MGRLTRNADVAKQLFEIGQLLEVKRVAFKPRAYQRAAVNVEALGEDVGDLAAQGRLGDVPGIGTAIEEKIKEFLATGKIRYLEDLRKDAPPGLLVLLQVPGIGPKSALRLTKELHIGSLEELAAAAKAGKIRNLPGFGARSEADILASLGRVNAKGPLRFLYPRALREATVLVEHLRRVPGAKRVEYAGSLRRGRDTVGDLDLVAMADADAAPQIVAAFTSFKGVVTVVEKGPTRARVILTGAMNADLRVVAPESFGAALLYFTGSKDHAILLRTRALKKGWTINEYALTRKKSGKRLAGATEEDIYAKLGLQYVPPELREGHDELDLAARRALPKLIQPHDVHGELHTHTDASDGASPLAAMVAEAARLGYAWFGVSDHAKGMGIVNGLDDARFRAQRKLLDRLQERFPKMRLLHGAEVDIKKDGTLAIEDATRQRLDYVIASVHGQFQLPRAEQTTRVLRAFDEGADVFAHPTTRKILSRGELDLDWEKVYDVAKERGIALEVNGGPDRLDLAGERVRVARNRGCGFTLSSDAHDADALRWISYAVTQARRGGLTASETLNALTPSQVGKRLGRSKAR